MISLVQVGFYMGFSEMWIQVLELPKGPNNERYLRSEFFFVPILVEFILQLIIIFYYTYITIASNKKDFTEIRKMMTQHPALSYMTIPT